MITCGCRLKERKKKEKRIFLEMLSFQTKFYTKNLKVLQNIELQSDKNKYLFKIM